MTAPTPIWQGMTTLKDLRSVDTTIREFGARLEQQARATETDAQVAGLLLSTQVANELRLAATQLKRAAAQVLELRIDLRVRIREVEGTARS